MLSLDSIFSSISDILCVLCSLSALCGKFLCLRVYGSFTFRLLPLQDIHKDIYTFVLHVLFVQPSLLKWYYGFC